MTTASQCKRRMALAVPISLESDYLLLAVLGGVLSSLLGALYPAWRAAGQDAVAALSYECVFDLATLAGS